MSPFLERFVLSSGFGGLAALIAATVALGGVLRASQLARRSALEDLGERSRARLKDQWWQRAKWALDLTVSPVAEVRVVGFKVLIALAESTEWAGTHEGDLIAAATEQQLVDAEPARWWTFERVRRHTGPGMKE